MNLRMLLAVALLALSACSERAEDPVVAEAVLDAADVVLVNGGIYTVDEARSRADTTDPDLGVIERDPDGSPSGTLRETAQELVRAAMPKPTPESNREALAAGIAHLNANGVTSFIDAWVGREDYEAYQALDRAVRAGLDAVEAARRQDVFEHAGPVLNENERVSQASMIDAYTINAAWLTHREDRTGSIEPGKRADVVVLDRDLFEIPATEINEAQIVMTLLEGEAVYKNQAMNN